jgi:hypothetical protein
MFAFQIKIALMQPLSWFYPVQDFGSLQLWFGWANFRVFPELESLSHLQKKPLISTWLGMEFFKILQSYIFHSITVASQSRHGF